MTLMTLDVKPQSGKAASCPPVTDAAPVRTLAGSANNKGRDLFKRPDWQLKSPINDVFCRYGYFYS